MITALLVFSASSGHSAISVKLPWLQTARSRFRRIGLIRMRIKNFCQWETSPLSQPVSARAASCANASPLAATGGVWSSALTRNALA